MSFRWHVLDVQLGCTRLIEAYDTLSCEWCAAYISLSLWKVVLLMCPRKDRMQRHFWITNRSLSVYLIMHLLNLEKFERYNIFDRTDLETRFWRSGSCQKGHALDYVSRTKTPRTFSTRIHFVSQLNLSPLLLIITFFNFFLMFCQLFLMK